MIKLPLAFTKSYLPDGLVWNTQEGGVLHSLLQALNNEDERLCNFIELKKQENSLNYLLEAVENRLPYDNTTIEYWEKKLGIPDEIFVGAKVAPGFNPDGGAVQRVKDIYCKLFLMRCENNKKNYFPTTQNELENTNLKVFWEGDIYSAIGNFYDQLILLSSVDSTARTMTFDIQNYCQGGNETAVKYGAGGLTYRYVDRGQTKAQILYKSLTFTGILQKIQEIIKFMIPVHYTAIFRDSFFRNRNPDGSCKQK